MTTLDERLLSAHETGNKHALVQLYVEAADQSTDETARGFYLTHAYVFALELGSDAAPELRRRLIGMGRETPL